MAWVDTKRTLDSRSPEGYNRVGAGSGDEWTGLPSRQKLLPRRQGRGYDEQRLDCEEYV